MLQRYFTGSARLLAAAAASCKQGASSQICQQTHARAVGEGFRNNVTTVESHCSAQAYQRATASTTALEKLSAFQPRAPPCEAQPQALSLYKRSAACNSSRSAAIFHDTPHFPPEYKNYHETPVNEQRRSFAKASRLVRPATRAARKAEERLPASQQAAADVDQGSSQPDVTGHESSSENAVVTQAQQSRASDVQVSQVVDHPALIVTREIEWGALILGFEQAKHYTVLDRRGNLQPCLLRTEALLHLQFLGTVILGFEQANRYTVLDQEGNTVALLAEDMGGLGKAVGRQLLRTRRSMTATVFSPDGEQIIFRMRKPAHLINSTIVVEDGEGNEIGEVKQRWHLWKRNYDIYLGRRQFADIQGNFLAWEFVLRDEQGGVLALIDRNFQGFGKELFTDAGKYVIHFGQAPQEAAEQVSNTIAAAHPDKPRPSPPVTSLAKIRTDVQVVPTQTGNQLEVVRPLQLDERMIALAAAISIDFNYFSQHSHGPGMMPGFLFPMPIPTPDYPPEGGDAPADAAGSPDEATAPGGEQAPDQDGSGLGSDSQPPPGQDSLERDLGGDSWDQGSGNEGGGWGGFGNDEELGGGDGGDGDGGGIWDLAKDFFGSD